jgi:hypothetical protein
MLVMYMPMLTVSGFVPCAFALKKTIEKRINESAFMIDFFLIGIICRQER